MTTTTRVTDAAAESLHASVVNEFRRHGQYTVGDAREALEAALPLLAPQPVVDREAVRRVIESFGTITSDRFEDALLDLLNGTAK